MGQRNIKTSAACPCCGRRLPPGDQSLTLDWKRGYAIRGGVSVELTKLETDIMYVLTKTKLGLVKYEALARKVYGQRYYDMEDPEHVLGVQMTNLRNKLRLLKVKIKRRHGRGYHLQMLPLGTVSLKDRLKDALGQGKKKG